MCFYYDEYAELCREKDVKARKQHKCSECYRPIIKGEIYQYIFTIFQGDVSVFKICPVCRDKRQKIHDIEISHGCKEHEAWPPFGELMECLDEYNLKAATVAGSEHCKGENANSANEGLVE